MKCIRLAALLLLCLFLLPACANDAQDGFVMPETHKDAISPDAVTTAHIVHYAEDGSVDLDVSLDTESLFVPLLATVYDKALETKPTGAAERTKLYDITMTGEGIEIKLAIYSDLTMEDGDVLRDGADMDAFLRSFLRLPGEETAA